MNGLVVIYTAILALYTYVLLFKEHMKRSLSVVVQQPLEDTPDGAYNSYVLMEPTYDGANLSTTAKPPPPEPPIPPPFMTPLTAPPTVWGPLLAPVMEVGTDSFAYDDENVSMSSF
jgi:hypothetical protein